MFVCYNVQRDNYEFDIGVLATDDSVNEHQLYNYIYISNLLRMTPPFFRSKFGFSHTKNIYWITALINAFHNVNVHIRNSF